MLTPVIGSSNAHAHRMESGASRLAREMDECWRRGERPCAEEFLDRCPELWQQPEAALRLVFEEICIRQERAHEDIAEEVMDRFPQWRSSLELLCECHGLTGTDPDTEPPAPGFTTIAELGRGGQGSVYLATQADLANRAVVVKYIPRSGQEHLTLARLQHTHIVPLYAIHEDPVHDRRILCMPFLGGASLAAILKVLADRPPSQRTGRDVLAALETLQASLPLQVPGEGPTRDWLAGAAYEEAICWMGSRLAKALHYAHQRGLVHLDLSAANVLLTAEGQPMLLDFHLSRAPLRPDTPGPHWVGGTPGYMAPEHVRAYNALCNEQPLDCCVDERADIYSLGVVLSESLGKGDCTSSAPLRRINSQVSMGFADILARCLAHDPRDRYPTAAALADDLCRHLAGQPLCGVGNRSLRERWRKWRRRQPLALAALLALLAIAAAGLVAVDHFRKRYGESEAALERGRQLLAKQEHAAALEQLEYGRHIAVSLPFQDSLTQSFDTALAHARRLMADERRAQAAGKLHDVVDQLRFLVTTDDLPPAQTRALAESCDRLWESRYQVVPEDALPQRLRTDLIELAILRAELHGRAAGDAGTVNGILDEAEWYCGASPALTWERLRHSSRLTTAGIPVPQTTWECVQLGRSYLWAGQLRHARNWLDQAAERKPECLWAHYYRGIAAYRRGDFQRSPAAFGICVALALRSGTCFYHRAQARNCQGLHTLAVDDYTRARRLDPDLAEACRRGRLLACCMNLGQTLCGLGAAMPGAGILPD